MQSRQIQARTFSPVIKLLLLGFVLLNLNACVSYEYHSTKTVNASRLDHESLEAISEEALLDVGITVFDAGLDLLDEDSAAFTSVRESEAVWFASQLKEALEYSNAWGAVRAMPSQGSILDLMISGKILESNGEVVRLFIEAKDATGRQWLSKEYFQRASAYAYNPEVKSNNDPFQSLFNEIANDLFDFRAQLSESELINTRSIAKVRFAKYFAPEVFDEYLLEGKEGNFKLQRIPAENDPMINRIERIQARNDLFLDVVQDYYRVFNGNMNVPYQEWRKMSYREVLYERQLKSQARKEKIAGVIAILAGVYAQTSDSGGTRGVGQVAILGGAELFKSGYSKADEAILHTETLRELGESLESELEPSIIDLQDRSITLSGTVEEQFKEWRRILAEIYVAEQGVVPSDSADEMSDADHLEPFQQ